MAGIVEAYRGRDEKTRHSAETATNEGRWSFIARIAIVSSVKNAPWLIKIESA